jgi:bifunctional non-homologous end joining protein LigD
VSPDRVEREFAGRTVTLSNLGKVLYPATGTTKGDVVEYYRRIAPVLLVHIRDRPLTLRRFPDGVDGKSFFEKHAPSHTPDWVPTTSVPYMATGSRRRSPKAQASETIEYAVVSDEAALAWAANLATIELHVPMWRVPPTGAAPGPPDYLVFDLDPGPGTSVVECCTVAGWLRERLAPVGRVPVPKTSGSKGLQLYAPLAPGSSWDSVGTEAHEVAAALEVDHPELVVTNMRKDLRHGRVLIDWSQNHPAKTTVAAYSLRARPEPTVSTPVTWDEVERCAGEGEAALLRFVAGEVLERVERLGDLFAPVARGS